MLVVCKENTKCYFSKTCEHSKLHQHSPECTYKNSRCNDCCICDKEYVFKFQRKEKIKKINEKSTL
jgi:hypothetical protein